MSLAAVSEQSVWAGVDVGGPRKGFHLGVTDGRRLIDHKQARSAEEAVRTLRQWQPILVAIDSPRRPALSGKSRPEERCLAKAICGIRYTPNREVIERNPHYEWIRCGWTLYRLIEREGLDAIECFPTASWTVWGRRRSGTRARWSAGLLRASLLFGAEL